jgi:phytoene/squalene synthetase
MRQVDVILAQARQTLAAKGKTFDWARRLLARPHADRATRLYAFCRHLDDLVDEASDARESRTRLSAVSEALRCHESADPVVSDAISLLDECGIDTKIPLALIDGLLADLGLVRLRDEAELLRYCYRVAGTVGLMMCDVLDVKDPEAAAFAIDLGVAMQLTNICRDVLEDARRGRRYLPASLVGELPPEALVRPSPATCAAVRLGVDRLLTLADAYYASGEKGLRTLPTRARHAIRVAGRVYQAIGGRLRERKIDGSADRAHVGLLRKAGITAGALLDGVLDSLAGNPATQHDANLHYAIRDLPRVSRVDPHEYALVILGGGCAGLSLAMRLAELGEACPRTAVVERRTSYIHDRTWCYWSTPAARLTDLASMEWAEVAVADASRRVVSGCAESPYAAIASADFYRAAVAAISLNPRIELRTATSVTAEPVLTGAVWRIGTSQGSLSGRQIVDTRPWRQGAAARPLMAQSFSGAEIECESDLFSARTATLMEFVPGPAEQVTFLYLLPYGPRRAMIEATVFGPRALSEAELTPTLKAMLTRTLCGRAYRVVHRECHVIPMGLPPAVVSLGIGHVRVGMEAGGVRAATGYGFQRIQQWAERAAGAVRQGRPIPAHLEDPWLVAWMDRLFLRVLRSSPELAPQMFFRLFARVNSAALTRFLSGEARFMDCLKVIYALPPGPFFRQLLKGPSQ